jgi:hypothetical protein
LDFKVQISEAELTDFEEILAYSWANFPDTAERFGNALLTIDGHPGVRQTREKADPDLLSRG